MRSGLTQAQAATALGQPQNFISKCETGERRIDPIELADFVALYETTFDALVPSTSPSASPSHGARKRRLAEPAVKPKSGKPSPDNP